MKFKTLLATFLSLGLMTGIAAANPGTPDSDVRVDLTPGFNFTGTLTSNYVRDGISQYNGSPVLRGDVRYEDAGTGLYIFGDANAAVFTTNKYGNSLPGNTNNYELVGGAGWKYDIGRYYGGDFRSDFSGEYHYYPNSVSGSNLDFGVIRETLNWVPCWGRVILSGDIEPQGQYKTGVTGHVVGGVDLNLPYKVILAGRFGAAFIENTNLNDNPAYHLPNYQYWSVGVERDFAPELNGHHAILFVRYDGASIDKKYTDELYGQQVVFGGQQVTGGITYKF